MSVHFHSLKVSSILLCNSLFYSDFECILWKVRLTLLTGIPSVILLQEFFMLIFISVFH